MPHIVGHSYQCLHNKSKVGCSCDSLEMVENYKYLGLIIDHHFSWKQHINKVCDKLRSVLVKFYHLKNVLNRANLYTVYYALADTLLFYGLCCYGRTFKTYLDKIKNLQIRFLKIIVGKSIKQQCKNNYNLLFYIVNYYPSMKEQSLLLL